MSKKDEYVAQMKAKLEEWNAEIDVLDAKARGAKARAAQDDGSVVMAELFLVG